MGPGRRRHHGLDVAAASNDARELSVKLRRREDVASVCQDALEGLGKGITDGMVCFHLAVLDSAKKMVAVAVAHRGAGVVTSWEGEPVEKREAELTEYATEEDCIRQAVGRNAPTH